MTTQVFTSEGKAGERLIRSFSGYMKSLGITKAFRKARYNRGTKTQKVVREKAINREAYRAKNKKKQFSV